MICFDLTINIKGDIKNLKKIIINIENLKDIFWGDLAAQAPAAVPNLI